LRNCLSAASVYATRWYSLIAADARDSPRLRILRPLLISLSMASTGIVVISTSRDQLQAEEAGIQFAPESIVPVLLRPLSTMGFGRCPIWIVQRKLSRVNAELGNGKR
jgi:hypothetical protein